MELLRKGNQPMKRCESIDPRIDYSSSAFQSGRLMLKLVDKMERVHENRAKHLEKCIEYADVHLVQEYVPATTFTWDQEAEDSFPIELPHKPVWDKTGLTITRINSNIHEQVRHEGTIDAGWKYRQICYNPDPPLSLEEQTRLHVTSIRADDVEGIQKRFEELRALYGFLRVCAENEIHHAND